MNIHNINPHKNFIFSVISEPIMFFLDLQERGSSGLKQALPLGDEHVQRHATLSASDHSLTSSALHCKFYQDTGTMSSRRLSDHVKNDFTATEMQIVPFNGCSDMRRAFS